MKTNANYSLVGRCGVHVLLFFVILINNNVIARTMVDCKIDDYDIDTSQEIFNTKDYFKKRFLKKNLKILKYLRGHMSEVSFEATSVRDDFPTNISRDHTLAVKGLKGFTGKGNAWGSALKRGFVMDTQAYNRRCYNSQNTSPSGDPILTYCFNKSIFDSNYSSRKSPNNLEIQFFAFDQDRDGRVALVYRDFIAMTLNFKCHAR
jgi:hypothetical protein